MNDIHKKDYLPDFVSKMKKENLADIVIETFSHYYHQALSGETGLIYDRDIKPVDLDEIQELGNLDIYQEQGEGAYKNAVRIVLNGGLGTSMGLMGPKSLLKVKGDHSFLSLINFSIILIICLFKSFGVGSMAPRFNFKILNAPYLSIFLTSWWFLNKNSFESL